MKKVVLIDRLTEVLNNKYEAVRVMAKEARRINSLLIRGAHIEGDLKPTTIAMQRFLDRRVKFDYVEEKDDEFHFEDEEE
jgi:DNA-directed RNA polymerase subunit K/omega